MGQKENIKKERSKISRMREFEGARRETSKIKLELEGKHHE